MKQFKIRYIAAICAAAAMFSGCLKETYPTSVITEKQLAMSTNALAALNRASAAAMNIYGSNYGSYGYPGIMTWRDVMAAEIPILASDYDYHSYYGHCQYLGDFSVQSDWWSLFYKVILNANLFVSAAAGNDDVSVLRNLGNALCYRAFIYMDLARMYEYQKTGYAELDNEAESRGIYGLTVPIYTEKTTEADSQNLPRAPFYEMYRFILTDLDNAEKYLEGYTSDSVNQAGASLVYGLKARLWLELASRFNSDLNTSAASDLELMKKNEESCPQYVKLGVKSAAECYANALKYARMAQQGHTPLTEAQWSDKATGFNTAQSSWIFGMMIGEEDVQGSWKSFTANLSPEQTYGTANSLYGGFRMIDASLYSKIGNSDWRKKTWISPSDAGKSSSYSKYVTSLSEADWLECPAYANFKFRPGQANGSNYLVGNAVDIPLMRVEEMHLIEAEAQAYVDGLSQGVATLEKFINDFRYTDGSYSANAGSMKEFLDEILTQRRIELWGEGLVIYDYRRLRKAVVRGYSGTNFLASYQYNSKEGYVAPWSTVYITSSEYQYNNAIEAKNNPDPSGFGEKCNY